MAANDMNHLAYIDLVARADADVLRKKEATYQGSWKRAGGRSAWFMFRRNMDRLLAMCAHVPFALPPERVFRALERGGEGLTLTHSEVQTLQSSLRSEDLFALIRAEPSGADGTVLACLRDLRRYATLVEAEMVAEGVVEIEGLGEPAKTITASEVKIDADIIEAADFAKAEKAVLASGVRVFDSVRLARLIAIADGGTRTAEAYSELGRQAAKKLESGGDIYSTIAELLTIERRVVKERLFVEMYHGSGPTKLGDLITSEVTPAEAEALLRRFHEASISAKEFLVPSRSRDGRILAGDASRQLIDNYEEKAIAQTLRYLEPSSQIGGDIVFVEGISPGAVLALRPGGSIAGRIAELVGTTEDQILTHIARRAYAPPRETEAENPPLELHKQISAAVSHALNYHGIDAELSTPGHILAELLAPQIVSHILGQTGPQLVEAGWMIGAGGVPVPPSSAGGDSPNPIPAGTRWTTLNNIGNRLRSEGKSDQIRRAIVEANADLCFPPLAGEEVEKIVRSFEDEPNAPATSGSTPGSWSDDIGQLVRYAREYLDRASFGTVQVKLLPDIGSGGVLIFERGTGGTLCKLESDRPSNIGPLTVKHVSAFVKSWLVPPGLPVAADEPNVPGTPADGGHLAPRDEVGGEEVRMVPRRDPVSLGGKSGVSELRDFVLSKLGPSLARVQVPVANHKPRRHFGPNDVLYFLGSRAHRHLLVSTSGNLTDADSWRIASNENINQLAALWFPAAETRVSATILASVEKMYNDVVEADANNSPL